MMRKGNNFDNVIGVTFVKIVILIRMLGYLNLFLTNSEGLHEVW